MKALGQVLNGTVLHPKGMTGDIVEQKGKLFQKYVLVYIWVHHVHVQYMYMVHYICTAYYMYVCMYMPLRLFSKY